MKPYQVLVFFLSVVALIFGLQLIFPSGFSLGELEVKIFSWGTWLEHSRPEKANVDANALLKLQAKTDELAISQIPDRSDSTGKDSVDASAEFSPMVADFHIDYASGIQYPSGDSLAFRSFFLGLDSLKSRNELIRILHFGDSQIEGDRITGYLRQRFQQLFGGCGPGLLPLAEETPSRFAIEIKAPVMPDRFVLYGKPIPAPHRNYSLLHTVFRLNTDSAHSDFQFSYRLRPVGFQRANYFEKAGFICRNPWSEVTLSGKSNGQKPEVKTLRKSDSLRYLSFGGMEKKTSMNFQVTTSGDNDFYGVSLDCRSGVAIDNIPLRGSSGMELLKINASFLKDQLRQMNVKLVILQFGINVVPYESKGYVWYEEALTKAIKTIKKARPDIQVLVVGVSDMAHRVDGQWQSFSNLGLVKEAQRNAARNTNSAFWDLVQVMGGENSIQAWAGTDPPLAGKDYIHLTPKGAQVVGEFLFQSLIREYQKAKQTTHSLAIP